MRAIQSRWLSRSYHLALPPGSQMEQVVPGFTLRNLDTISTSSVTGQ
jgi:hypothetical protein